MSNLYGSLIGNFEDIVQYNKDNKAFEGGKHDNVTIETLCDIMAGGREEENSEMSEFDEMTSFLKETFLNRFDDDAPKKKTSLEYFADVNEFYLNIHGQECFDVSYDEMIKELRDVSYNKNVGGRQWIYQTCTEFGWYQSSDQPGHPFLDHFPVQGRSSVEYLTFRIFLLYRVNGGRDLGLGCFECSTILPSCPADSANFPKSESSQPTATARVTSLQSFASRKHNLFC